jgi:hypothetical protein
VERHGREGYATALREAKGERDLRVEVVTRPISAVTLAVAALFVTTSLMQVAARVKGQDSQV